MAWLIENTEPDWRPDEWDAANWLFTGDPAKDETAIWRCNSAGCHVAVRCYTAPVPVLLRAVS
jgi:hypothetical protein